MNLLNVQILAILEHHFKPTRLLLRTPIRGKIIKQQEHKCTFASLIKEETCQSLTTMDETEKQSTTANADAEQTNSENEDLAGQILDNHFRIDEKLGSGGMSEVYAALDLSLGRKVAIKFMHPWLISDSSYLDRFRQEAKTTGKLKHEGIINIYHYGVDERHRPYIVMDFISGVSLSEKFGSDKKVEITEAISILKQIVRALAFAHSQGVVHRDIKPSNVMCWDSETGVRAVLVYFGIAKIVQNNSGKAVTQLAKTSTGEVLGSPQYMSPEQCLGAKVDSRSDIYSLGCLIFALLTGQPPFESTNVYEIYFSQLNDSPPSIKKLRPELREASAFDVIILRCMAKDPKDRYQDLNAVLLALEQIESHKASNTHSIFGNGGSLFGNTASTIALRFKAGKLKIPTWKIALALLSLSISICSTLWYLGVWSVSGTNKMETLYTNGQKSLDTGDYNAAQSELAQAIIFSKTSMNLHQFTLPCLNQMLDLSRCSKNVELESDTVKQLDEHKKARLSKELGDLEVRLKTAVKEPNKLSQEEKVALIEETNDTTNIISENGNLEKSLALLQMAETLGNALNPPDIVARRTLHNLGNAYEKTGDYKEAEAHFKAAIEMIAKQLSPSDPATIAELICLAKLCKDDGRIDQAAKYLARAMSTARVAYGGNSEQAAFVKTSLAEMKIAAKKPSEAIRELNQAKSLFDGCTNPDPSKYARCITLLAYVQGSPEQLKQALELQEKAVKQEPGVLAWLLQQTGAFESNKLKDFDARYEKAAPYYRRAIAILLRSNLHNQKELNSALDNYFPICTAANQINEAVYWMKVKTKLEASNPNVSIEQIIQSKLQLAKLESQVGNIPEARRLGTEALAQARQAQASQTEKNSDENSDKTAIEDSAKNSAKNSECLALIFLVQLFQTLQETQTAQSYAAQLTRLMETSKELPETSQKQAQALLNSLKK